MRTISALRYPDWLWAALSCVALMVLPSAAAGPTARQELEEVLRNKPDPERGAELFRLCVVCHGAAGVGTADGGVPAIGGQPARVIAKQLVDFRHGERLDIRMERFTDRHVIGTTQIAQVAAYASLLRPELPTGVGSGEWVARGEEIYGRLCRSCHGAYGEGNGDRFVPWLARQNYRYLLREMQYTLERRRPNMSGFHLRLLRSLDGQSLLDVADYLSRLAPSPGE